MLRRGLFPRAQLHLRNSMDLWRMGYTVDWQTRARDFFRAETLCHEALNARGRNPTIVDRSTGSAFQLDGLNRRLNVIAARSRSTETLGATGYSQSIDPRYNTDCILTSVS